MPWTETGPMEERLQFVRDALSDRFTMSELCARFGISRLAFRVTHHPGCSVRTLAWFVVGSASWDSR